MFKKIVLLTVLIMMLGATTSMAQTLDVVITPTPAPTPDIVIFPTDAPTPLPTSTPTPFPPSLLTEVVYLPFIKNDALPPTVAAVFGNRDNLHIIGYVNSACHKAELEVEVKNKMVLADVVSKRHSPCPEHPFFELWLNLDYDSYIYFINDDCVLPQIGCTFERPE